VLNKHDAVFVVRDAHFRRPRAPDGGVLYLSRSLLSHDEDIACPNPSKTLAEIRILVSVPSNSNPRDGVIGETVGESRDFRLKIRSEETRSRSVFVEGTRECFRRRRRAGEFN